MLYRACPDLTTPTEADLDTPEMVGMSAAVALAEQHLRMLTRMAEVGMELIEAIAQDAKADPATASATGDAFCKISQAVRRTIALQAKLSRDAKIDRDGLIADRAGRRAARDTAHQAAKTKAVLYGFHDAYAGSSLEKEYAEVIERLMEDTEEYLGDADEFHGWLDRPFGETVAKLCAALGLDPDACALDGETWKVRRLPTEFELCLKDRARKFGKAPPSPPGEGQTAKPSGWGTLDEAPRRSSS